MFFSFPDTLSALKDVNFGCSEMPKQTLINDFCNAKLLITWLFIASVFYRYDYFLLLVWLNISLQLSSSVLFVPFKFFFVFLVSKFKIFSFKTFSNSALHYWSWSSKFLHSVLNFLYPKGATLCCIFSLIVITELANLQNVRVK